MAMMHAAGAAPTHGPSPATRGRDGVGVVAAARPLPRRTLLTALLAAPTIARAQDSRPVTLLVGSAPGGGTDILARFLAPPLSTELGQSVAVENRTGAGGTLAGAMVGRARPDGLTMGLATVSTAAVAPPMLRPPPLDIFRDQTAVVLAGTVPLVALVRPDSPARDLAGLVALAKARPGELTYGSSGIGSQQHLCAEWLAMLTGTRLTHVPYRGTGQTMQDLMAGRLDFTIDTLPSNLPQIRGGSLRPLAVTMAERVEWLPDTPTFIESGFADFESTVWYMVMGPAGLPAPIVERWAAAVTKLVRDPALGGRIRASGYLPGGGTPAEAAALLRRDAEKYAEIIRRADIRVE